MEGDQRTTAEGAGARPPFPLEEERPPTPCSEPVLTPREREEGSESRLSWYEQDQEEREAERITAGFVEVIFLRAAERIEAMQAEQEATLMCERVAEAAMRRIHDSIVIMDDETPSVSDAERERRKRSRPELQIA